MRARQAVTLHAFFFAHVLFFVAYLCDHASLALVSLTLTNST